MLVAVIDDGIIPEMFSIGPLRYDMCVTKRGCVRRRKPEEKITTNHGTTVAGIIRKYAPDAEFCSVRVFSDNLMKTTCGKLFAALKWCLKKNIPVINLSLGTVDPLDFKKIRRITDKLLRNGQIIVAACNRNGKYTMPAMYPGVIGVKTHKKLTDDDYMSATDTEGVNFIASSSHELVSPDGRVLRTLISNSYAAPTVTAAVLTGRIDAEIQRESYNFDHN